MVRPAYQIPLNQKEFAQLGELLAILSQADDIMVGIAAFLLKVDRAAANVIMGSSKVGDNVQIWAETIRNRTIDEDILWMVEIVIKEMPGLSESRNDFIHAVFSHPMQILDDGSAVFGGPEDGSPAAVMTPTGPVMVTRRPPLARRVRNIKTRAVSDLPAIIDRAGRLSCILAHIGHLIAGNPATTSPWLERLGPTLPPRLDTVAARKAKAQRGRQKPSRQ